jgi:hypothetical protein
MVTLTHEQRLEESEFFVGGFTYMAIAFPGIVILQKTQSSTTFSM